VSGRGEEKGRRKSVLGRHFVALAACPSISGLGAGASRESAGKEGGEGKEWMSREEGRMGRRELAAAVLHVVARPTRERREGKRRKRRTAGKKKETWSPTRTGAVLRRRTEGKGGEEKKADREEKKKKIPEGLTPPTLLSRSAKEEEAELSTHGKRRDALLVYLNLFSAARTRGRSCLPEGKKGGGRGEGRFA